MSALDESRSVATRWRLEPDLIHRRMLDPAPGLLSFLEARCSDRTAREHRRYSDLHPAVGATPARRSARAFWDTRSRRQGGSKEKYPSISGA